MSEAIRIRARHRDGLTEITILAPHPMETGMRRDARGEPIPAHFITELTASIEGRQVIRAEMTFAVAADPLLSFRVRAGRAGNRIEVAWVDSRGERRRDSALIA